MINVSLLYKQKAKEKIRRSYLTIKYGNHDKKAKGKIVSTLPLEETMTMTPFSNYKQTFDEIKTTSVDYISCERNRTILNGNFNFIQNKNVINEMQNIGVWSKNLSNENGYFEETNRPTIIYNFTQEIEYTDLTLYLQEVIDTFKITYYDINDQTFTKTISDNEELIVETKGGTTEGFEMKYFKKVKISFIKTKIPHRKAKLYEVDFGVYKTFTNDEIQSIDIIDEISADNSELSSNSFTLTLKNINDKYSILNPYNELKKIQEKQEMTLFHHLDVGGNFYKETPLGTFLLKEIKIADNNLVLTSYDNIYFMNKIYYNSKFYDKVHIKTILEDLFKSFDFTKYEICEEILENNTDFLLTGYIPQVQMREALRLIAEASCFYREGKYVGIMINQNRYGITRISLYERGEENPYVVDIVKQKEVANQRHTKNLFNNVIDTIVYEYSISDTEVEVYNKVFTEVGEHTISFNKFPIVHSLYENNPNLIKKDITDTSYDVISISATSCVIKVKKENAKVELIAKVYNTSKKTERIFKDTTLTDVDSYSIANIDNTLITQSNYREVANWKLLRNNVKYSFDINLTPYIEVGDTLVFLTNYSNLKGETIKRKIRPTRIQISNALIERIEGE